MQRWCSCYVQVLETKLEDADKALEGISIKTVKGGDTIELGRRTLQCISVATPRYPELLCLYERTTRKLFSSCFFSAHVNPQRGVVGNDGSDLGGWAVYSSDWQFFFDCMFAPVVKQASGALEKLNLQTTRRHNLKQPFAVRLKNLFTSSDKKSQRPVAMILPRHGPIARQSVTQLINAYTECASSMPASSGGCVPGCCTGRAVVSCLQRRAHLHGIPGGSMSAFMTACGATLTE
jgi:flavorubredoxin